MNVAALQNALRDPEGKKLASTSSSRDVATSSGSTVRVVREAPEELARQSGAPLEVYSLARCIRSEGYGGANDENDQLGRAAAAVAIGQAVRNAAERSKTSITAKLTYSTVASARGLYGQQGGRYAATTSDPTRWHIWVADAVLDGQVPDLARGCHKFLDPAVWGNAIRKGLTPTQAGKKLQDFVAVMRSWHADEVAFTGYMVPTVDPYHLAFFRRETSAAVRAKGLEHILEVFDAGVDGKSSPASGNPDAPSAAMLALLATVAAAAAAAWVLS